MGEPSKAVLITGCSSGIGRAIAVQLAEAGHQLILVARGRERLEAVARELAEEHGVRAAAVPADLADAAERDRMAADVERLGTEIDILVNAAGWGVYEPFVETARERSIEQVRLLVEAVVDLDGRYVPAMVERGRGAVINLSSTAGLQPLPYNADYAAAKAFVEYHSAGLHAELKGTGVTVTAVLPGPVPSGFQEASDAGYFAEKLPKVVFVTPERVARDSLRAAARGKRALIPGSPLVRLAFGPNRFAPRAMQLMVARRLMARG